MGMGVVGVGVGGGVCYGLWWVGGFDGGGVVVGGGMGLVFWVCSLVFGVGDWGLCWRFGGCWYGLVYLGGLV
uniref:NADH dehydrogenase subunit 6 n=1 Tax=Knipowitschia caucasica TaxID=637954 RepID=A0AAV2KMW2_KNICA